MLANTPLTIDAHGAPPFFVNDWGSIDETVFVNESGGLEFREICYMMDGLISRNVQ